MYAPYGSKLVLLYYVDDCVYWYTYDELRKWFVDKLGKRLKIKLPRIFKLVTSISISHIKDHSISVYHDRYATSIVEKYLYTATIKLNFL